MNNKIKDEAAEWVLLLSESDNSNFPIAEWREWMLRSPEHLQVFQSMLDIWGLADSIDFLPELASDIDINQSRVADKSLYGFKQASAALFFGVCLALMWVLNSGVLNQEKLPNTEFQGRYSTAKAEHRSLRLPDGTQVDMGADSVLEIDFDYHLRNIILHQGESFFQVAKDSKRPLTVYANKSATRVVGTAFNVKRWLHRTTISVTEGVVEVAAMDQPVDSLRKHGDRFITDKSTPSLTPGQAISVTNDGRLSEVEYIQPQHQVDWKMGHLIFLNQQLDSVVADLNRYSDTNIAIRGDAISTLTLSGTVKETNIAEWLHSLPRVFDVKVASENGQLVISPSVN